MRLRNSANLRRASRGQGLVEFAITVPVLLLILLIVIANSTRPWPRLRFLVREKIRVMGVPIRTPRD